MTQIAATYQIYHLELDLSALTAAKTSAENEKSGKNSTLQDYLTTAITNVNTFISSSCQFSTSSPYNTYYGGKQLGTTPAQVTAQAAHLNAITTYVNRLNTAWGFEESKVPNAVYTLLHSCDQYGDPNNSDYSTSDIEWATGVLDDAIGKANATTGAYQTDVALIAQYKAANASETSPVKYDGVSDAEAALELATSMGELNTAMGLISKRLMLLPAYPSYPADTYTSVVLSRTLKAGYNSLALPFGTTVATLTGRSNAGDWVAQLQTVTYNAQDGYTLYFQKGDGTIAANQPYVLHLADGTANITNPTFSGQAVSAPSAQTVTPSSGYDGQDDINSSYEDWTMRSNFTKGFSMAGKYGIVNSAGGLMLGGEGSTLNAFSAYIQPPTGAAGVRVQSAYIDWDGTIDYVPGLPGEASDFEDSAVYDLSGRRISHPVRGLNIIRRPDGTVRKVMAR